MKKITLILTMLFLVTFSWLGNAQTFNGATGAIPDNACPTLTPYIATAAGVGTLGTTNQFDEVVINITHTWDADVQITLLAPDGATSVPLSIGNGDSSDNYTDTHFRADAATAITDGSAPFTGNFLPEGDLSTLNGLSGDGDWTLQVCDSAGGDTGTVDSWSISFVPVPACSNPTPTFSSISQTLATANWTAGVNAANYDYELQNSGDPQGTMPAIASGNTAMLTVNFTGLTSGNTYDMYIKSDCETVYAGPFSFTTTTGNDACVDATTIICGDLVAGSTTTATPETIGAFTGSNESANSVWYKFVGDGSAVTLSTCNDSGATPGDATYDTKIDVYSGDCANLVHVGGNDDNNGASCGGFSSLFEFTASMGTDYFVRVYGFGGTDAGDFNLSVECVTACSPLAPNDDCANATAAVNGVQVIGDNTCQTNALSNPSCDGFGVINDVWFDYTTDAASAGLGVTLDFNDGTFTADDVKFAIYTGGCGGTQALCDATNTTAVENLISSVPPSTNLKFQVWSTTAGTFGLTIVDFIAPDCVETPSPADNAIDVVTTGGDVNVTWANAATGETPTAYEVYLGTATGVLTLQGTVNAPDTNFTFTGLADTTEYFWQVIPFNGGAAATGCPEWSFTTETPACLDPTTLNVANVTQTSADLGWTENNGVSTWNIKWGATGFDLATGGTTVSNVTVNPHNLMGLMAGTTYDFYVQTECVPGSFGSPAVTSSFAGPFTFVTPAVNADCTGAIAVLDGVTTTSNITDTTGGTNGGDSAWYVYTATGDGTIEISSCIDPNDTDTRLFTFDGTCATLNALLDDDDGCPGTFGSLLSALPVVNGTDYYIQWDDRWSVGVDFDWIVNFTPAPACAAPTSLATDTLTDTSVNVTWTDGFGCTTAKSVTVMDTATSTPIAGSPFTVNCGVQLLALSGLTPETEYIAEVINDCGANPSDTITFTTLVTPQTANCGAYTSSPAGIITDTAILSDIITVAGTGPDIIDDLNVILNVNHTFVGDMVITITSPTGTNVIILDGSCGSNDDLDVTFDDEGAAIICATPVSGVYLPANALSAFDGETFDGDWTISIEDTFSGDDGILNQWCLVPTLVVPPACAAPTSLATDTLTDTSVNVTWTDGFGCTTAKSVTVMDTATSTPIAGSPFTVNCGVQLLALSGLTPETEYIAEVINDCGANPSDTITFTTLATPPANDTCATATPIACGDDLVGETNAGATDNGDAVGCTQGVGVWYKFVGNDMDVTITSTTDFDHEIGVASSSDCATFTNVACQDGATGTETVTFSTVTGTDYYIYIGSFSDTSTATGTFGINVTCVPTPVPPVNDDCGAGNIDLTVFATGASAGNETAADTTAATASAESLTSCDGFGTNVDLFYNFTMPVGETAVNVLTTGATGSAIELVVKDACGGTEIAGTCLGNSGNHALTGLTGGTTYVLQVWHDDFNAGVFDIALELPPMPPANDTCATATLIACGDDLVGETNAGATDNGDDVGCGQGVGVWYKFVGNDMDVTITSTTDFDHEIGVASSADCVTFTNVACQDGSIGTETVTFSTVTGTDYYIYIGSFSDTSTATGTFGINVTCIAPIVNDDCANAEALTVGLNFGEHAVVGSNASATASGELPTPSCSSFGTGEDVWYSVTVPASGNVTIESKSDGGPNDWAMSVYSGSCGALTEVECDDDDGDGFFPMIILTGQTPNDVLLVRFFEFENNDTGTFQIAAYDSSCSGVTTTWTGTSAAGSWDNGAPSITTPAIIDGEYITSANGDINACTLTLTAANGDLTVSANTFVNVVNDITNDGIFLVENQGSVVQVNDVATVTGAAIGFDVEITTTVLQDAIRFTYFSSPTNAGDFGVFSNFSVGNWEYNDAIQNWSYLGGGNMIGAMNTGQGYAIRGGSNATETVDFSGAFNNGIVTRPLFFDVYNNVVANYANPLANNDDSNFVGNPYPSAISADDLITANPIGGIYMWTHESAIVAGAYAGDDYIECVVGTCTAAPSGGANAAHNGLIASGQGFFVTATAAGTLTFNNAMRSTTGNDQFRNTDDQKLWLNMTTEQGYGKQIALTFTENGSANFDEKYESKSFGQNFGLGFYSFNAQADKLTINDTGLLTNDRTIPLGFYINETTINGATISIGRLQNLEDTNVYLIDHLLNVTHDLKVSDYQIAITETGEVNDRFEILFNRDSLSTNDDIIANDTLVVSNQNATQIKVNMLDGIVITNFKAYDVLGKLVIDMKANSNDFIINTNIKQGQVLFIKATLENGQVLSNKFLKL